MSLNLTLSQIKPSKPIQYYSNTAFLNEVDLLTGWQPRQKPDREGMEANCGKKRWGSIREKAPSSQNDSSILPAWLCLWSV